MDNKDNKKRTLLRDMLLVGGLLLVGAGLMVFLLLSSHSGSFAEIRIDGRVTASLPLDQDVTKEIVTAHGKNVVVVEKGEVYVSFADCPDGICKNTGRIGKSGQTIICLPHKLVIEIKGQSGDDPSNTDIIVR